MKYSAFVSTLVLLVSVSAQATNQVLNSTNVDINNGTIENVQGTTQNVNDSNGDTNNDDNEEDSEQPQENLSSSQSVGIVEGNFNANDANRTVTEANPVAKNSTISQAQTDVNPDTENQSEKEAIQITWFPGSLGYCSGSSIGAILASLFGNGYNGIRFSYGTGNLFLGILSTAFGDSCNGKDILNPIFEQGYQGECRHNFYVLYRNSYFYGSRFTYKKIENGEAMVEIYGLPRNQNKPKGIIQLIGDEKNLVGGYSGQVRMNPNGKFKLLYL